MKRKKNLFVWLFIFTFLSTISLNFLNERNFSTFSIEKINITGIVNLNEADFQNQLNRFYGKSLIFLNRKDLNEIGSKFVFINEIKIKKSYPNTLNIKVKENKPLGILFDNSEKILLLENDKIVNNSLLIDNKNLFKIKGKGAKKKFSGFYQRLNTK